MKANEISMKRDGLRHLGEHGNVCIHGRRPVALVALHLQGDQIRHLKYGTRSLRVVDETGLRIFDDVNAVPGNMRVKPTEAVNHVIGSVAAIIDDHIERAVIRSKFVKNQVVIL